MPKPTRAQLKSLIDAVLSGINPAASAYLNRNTADAAYAAYVFGLVLRAVKRVADPGSVYLDSAKSGGPKKLPKHAFVIRGAPGPLHSTDQAFGFACFAYKKEKFEIHLGVQYRGSSAVLHEIRHFNRSEKRC